MDYFKIYTNLITKCTKENRKRGQPIYYESHHIIPACLGGSNKKNNRILLTAREHFVAHKLLFKIYPNNKKIALAYHSIVYTMQDKRKIKRSSRDFQLAREAASFASKGENNPRYGKKLSEETKRKIGETHKGNTYTKGTTHSIETKMKISVANKGRLLGIPKSQQMKDRLSKTNTGRVGGTAGKRIMTQRKPISAVCPLGNYMEFSGAIEMKYSFGLNPTCILECLNGQQKTTRGWSNFKYINK